MSERILFFTRSLRSSRLDAPNVTPYFSAASRIALSGTVQFPSIRTNRILSGKIVVKGKEVRIKVPADAQNAGLSLVPEDRKQQGVLLKMSIRENTVLSIEKKLSRFTVVSRKKEEEITWEYFKKLKTKAPNIEFIVGNLSGGNQQKVAIAKSLAAGADIIILDEPTRGIDVGAKSEIYQLMRDLTEQGISIIMISSEMGEVIGMSDRILVVRGGSIVGELQREEFDQELILTYASGIKV